jgi:hypothetical protein
MYPHTAQQQQQRKENERRGRIREGMNQPGVQYMCIFK